MDKILEQMINNYKRYFPAYYADSKEFKQISNFEILAVFNEDGAVIYDDFDRTVRFLPRGEKVQDEVCFCREFGRRLTSRMRHRQITQTELSELTGISRPTINEYANGRTMPGLFNIDKIARVLKCTIDDLTYIDFKD